MTRRPPAKSGRLDRVATLDVVTNSLHRASYPDESLQAYALTITQVANHRKRATAATYRKEIKFTPALKDHYDIYDPGWHKW